MKAIPVIERFEPRIEVMEEQKPPKSRWVNEQGQPTCPACGCHEFSVRDSEPWQGGVKSRYRTCAKCGLPVKTKETFEE